MDVLKSLLRHRDSTPAGGRHELGLTGFDTELRLARLQVEIRRCPCSVCSTTSLPASA